MGDPARLRELERRLEELEAAPPADSPARVPTGVEALDALLPRGGLPRGEATEWLGPRSCGKLALLRAALARMRGAGEPVAVVDASRTLRPADWWRLAEGAGPFWVLRPSPGEAAWCADLLLRSGTFGAVALLLAEEAGRAVGGEGGLGRSAAVRLQRLAGEAGALLVVAGRLPVASLRLRFRPGRVEPLSGGTFGPFLPLSRPVWVRLPGAGSPAEIPVLCPEPPLRTRVRRVRDRKGRGQAPSLPWAGSPPS